MQSCLIIKILSVLFSNYVLLCPCTKRSIMYAFLKIELAGFFKMTFEMSKGGNYERSFDQNIINYIILSAMILI